MIAVEAFLIFALAFLLTLAVLTPREEEVQILKHLERLGGEAQAGRPGEEDVPFRDRVLLPLIRSGGDRLMRLTPKRQLDRIRGRLARAGDPLTPAAFLSLRIVLMATAIIPLAMGGRGIFLAAVVGLLGYRAPDFWLSRRIASRQKAFSRLLPDSLDLLAVSVEAGMGFDGALQRVAERARSPIREEMMHTLSEMHLGRPRAEALQDLAERMDVAELHQFVQAVVQAEALGVGMARPLRVQADTLRVRRRQRAEEAAMKTPVKLIFPLVFLIFPALFVVLLGPALLTFGRTLHP